MYILKYIKMHVKSGLDLQTHHGPATVVESESRATAINGLQLVMPQFF